MIKICPQNAGLVGASGASVAGVARGTVNAHVTVRAASPAVPSAPATTSKLSLVPLKVQFFRLTEFWPEILVYKSLNWQISVRVWVCSTDTSTSPAPLESDWFTHAVVELGFRFRLFWLIFFLFDLISRYLSTMGNEVYLMISTLTIEPNHFFRVQRWRLESVEWV